MPGRAGARHSYALVTNFSTLDSQPARTCHANRPCEHERTADRETEETSTEDDVAGTPPTADVTEEDELVRDLEAADVPVGLGTSSFPYWVAWTLERLGLVGAFDAEVLAPELDGPGKPEPFIYKEAARRLGVRPEACLVVEDSASGIEAADRAGAYVLAYRAPTSDGEQDVSRADEVIEGPAASRERVRALAVPGTRKD